MQVLSRFPWVRFWEISYTRLASGIIGGKKFKAIQSGGPSGGCLTKTHLNTPVDYESLSSLGAIMGSGGLIVMNEDTCMVDTARYFIDFICDESCGKCLPCRNGTRRMLEILERITEGKGRPEAWSFWRSWPEPFSRQPCAAWGRRRPIRFCPPSNISAANMRPTSMKSIAAQASAPSFRPRPAAMHVLPNVFIPGYMSLLAAGRTEDAYRLIRQDNPFPAVCGRVCTHPCEDHCRRAQVDEPLAICSVKRFIGDYALRDEYNVPLVEPRPATGKRISVIGAGPSGLHALTIWRIWAMRFMCTRQSPWRAAFCTGAFRSTVMPKAVLQKEIHAIERSGVQIHLNTRIGSDITFEDMKKQSTQCTLLPEPRYPGCLMYRARTLRVWKAGLDS